MDLVSGAQFRRLVRQHQFGSEEEERYVATKHGRPVTSIDPYFQLVAKHVQPPLLLELETTPKYFVLHVWLLKEEESDDFGSPSPATVDDEEVQKTHQFVHSFVDRETGEVYLPDDDTEEHPQLALGPRCNANELETCTKFGLDPTSGKLKPFHESASVLLDLGVDVDDGDVWGESALMHACYFLDLPAIKWLVARGASPNKQTRGSKSHALFRALEAVGSVETRLEVLDILINQAGANVNLANRYKWTPLHCVKKLGLQDEVYNLLVRHGANAQARDCFDKLPAEYSNFW